MSQTSDTSRDAGAPPARKPYTPPLLRRVGSLAELTHGFSGSLPDEQGAMTKRNPFQG
ncbi:MAG: lasso RiPP family leader peptide-containing protein [Gammaproteobacteria bacterium]|nr:lasso RiPP family leader peptide-containing protein [Gammaproteobacteria bacterium]